MIRNHFYFLLLLLLPVAADASKPFRITGNLHLPDHPAWAHLYYALDGQQVHDSTRIVNDRFTFAGELDEPVMAYLVWTYPPAEEKQARPAGGRFYLEPGNITITNDADKHLVVQGSLLNEESAALQQEMRAIGQPSSEQDQQAMKEKYLQVQKDFISKHPASFISLELLKGFYDYTLEQKKTAFAALAPTVRQSRPGKAFAESLENQRRVQIGAPAPDFTEKDTAGIAVSLKDFRGKYVLVDFWASWCHPCREENPNVLKAYNKYKDRNFTVLSVSLDRSRAEWIKAITADQLPWKHISNLDPQQATAAKLYAVEFIPQNFLIDPEGKIIAHNLKGAALDKLDTLLR
ncbi:TlpA disulfide reductase family protein [Chitinophaga vietnamensis]|uniref:TlpA disulfide reductase family protein n=1 Tax=Chitinophaga vietnamensis TaxID=2593957 RepID=UPI001177650F|nr:TlpA disulfide reductase family protein [Chitinophaga vietnamensis]